MSTEQEYSCVVCSDRKPIQKFTIESFVNHIEKTHINEKNGRLKNHVPRWYVSLPVLLAIFVSYVCISMFSKNFSELTTFSAVVALLGFGFAGVSRWVSIRNLEGCARRVVGGRWNSSDTTAKVGEWKDGQSKVKKFGLIAFPLTSKEKTPVLSTIFGFLASLAITFGLMKYYDNFITAVVIEKASSFNGLLPLLDLTSITILPTLRLIDFFIIAIPLTHSGYLFLSSLVIHNKTVPYTKNPAFGLVLIFIISIIQAGFLFFLANSIATPSLTADSTTTQQNLPTNSTANVDEETAKLQSNLFVFWLTLTAAAAVVGSSFAKRMIEENRIPQEWVLL